MSEEFKGRVWDGDRGNFDRNLAVVIGIDQYQNDSIKDLSTAVGDARAIADLLEQKYDYKQSDKQPKTIRLFDEEATLEALQHLFNTQIPNELNPGKGDRLIIYFAGHGLPRSNDDGPEGYLVPHDADSTKPESFLAMRDVSMALSKLACHHLLVILDCCFAGTFRWAGSRKAVPILESIRREHYYHFIRNPAWQVITSSAHDQEALDVARLQEDNRKSVPGLREPHSPFALAILEALQMGDDLKRVNADLYPDGVVTAHELFVYLQSRVKALSGEQQNPGIFPLRQEYDKGEFIFTRPEFDPQKLAEALPLNEDNNPYRGLNSFDEKHAKFFFGRQVLIDELAKRLLKPDQALSVVLGVSGSGKSSLVKAGLIPHLRNLQRDRQTEQPSPQWYILDPMRPGELPFVSLARTLLPVVNVELLEQVAQVSFLDGLFEPMLTARTEAKQNLVRVAQDPQVQTDETLMKVAGSWCSATPEAKLLLIEDYFTQLGILGNPQQQEQLRALYKQILAEINSVSQQLHQEPQYFSRVIASWSQQYPDTRLLLVIDQFEELFTRSQEDRGSPKQNEQQEGDHPAKQKAWQKFLEVLRIAISDHAQNLRLVLTLRSDFEPRFLSSGLESYWKEARYPVRAMTSDELRQAIENPALKQALYFEELKDDKGNTTGNLVSKLVDEVGQMPGALPLLSFTLSELYVRLYERWKEPTYTGRTLLFEDYETLGGVAGALTRRADKEYAALDKDHQATMQRVMLRMVAIEGGGAARRRVAEPELVYTDAEEDKRVKQILDRLVEGRLLVRGQEAGELYVEPAHDFLVRGWQQLQQWIRENQRSLVLQRELIPTVDKWASNQQEKLSRGLLWNDDPRLPLAQQLMARTPHWFNFLESEFVQKSVKRKRSQRNRLVSVTAGVMAALSVLTVFSFIQRSLAETRGRNVLSRQLAVQAERLLSQRIATQEAGALLAVKSLEPLQRGNKESVDVNQSLRRALATPIPLATLTHEQFVRAVSLSADGERVATASEDNTARIWDATTGEPIVTLTHDNWVVAVSFSPDGERIATASVDGTARVWDAATGEPIATLTHEGQVTAMSFSPNGKQFATASGDGTARIRDATTGELIATFTQDGVANTVIFSADGERIATASDNKTARVWDAATGEPIATLTHEGQVTAMSFSPNGKQFATASGDGTARILDAATGEPIAILTHEGPVAAMSFSPDSKQIATASVDKTARIWNATTGEPIATLIHDDEVTSVSFSADGKQVATASEDKTARIWDAATGEPIATLTHEGPVAAMSFSPDGRRIITIASGDNMARIWNTATGEPIATLTHEGLVAAMSFSPDGRRIITTSDDDKARVWDAATDEPIATHDDWVSFSADGKQVATASGDNTNTARIWNTATGELIATLTHEGPVTEVSFSPDGRRIITTSDDDKARVWDAAAGELIATLTHEGSVAAMSFSPNGKQFATASGDGTARIRDATTGELIATFTQDGVANTVIFSADGERIATASDNKTARVWDAATGEPIATLTHEGQVTAMSFSPNGKQFATASGDGTARILDAATGEPIAILTHEGPVAAMSFSPDSKQIATASVDKTARIWNATTGEPIATLIHDDEVTSVSFSADGKQVATASEDKTARIWDAAGESIVTLIHEAEVYEVSLSADGKQVATASLGTAIVWNAATGEPIATLTHDDEVNTVSLSADGKQVATASDNAVQVRWLWSRDMAEQVCQRLRRNLTAAEWTNYIQTDLMNYSLTCHNWPVHPTLVAAAQNEAEAGHVKDATALFRRFLKLSRDANQVLDIDPSTEFVEQNPKAVALKFSAVKRVREAEALAKEGEVEKAIARFQKALSLNPEIDLDPSTKEVVEQDPESVATAIAARADR